MHTKRRTHVPSLGTISRAFLLAALILLSTACAAQSAEVIPTPQVFNIPVRDISIFTRYFRQGCHFGGAIDMDKDILAVGAPCWSQPLGNATGSAHILRRSPEGELYLEASLTASDRDDGFQYAQHFGESLALNGTIAAIGAPGYDDPQAGDNSGAVYIFEYDGSAWVETGKLIPANPTPGAKIGTALAFDGDLLAVSGSAQGGSIFIFERQASGWRQAAEVPVPSTTEDEEPYVLLDLYGDTLALSTITWQEPAGEEEFASLRRTGVVTLYERNGDEWKQIYQTAPEEASLYRMYAESPFGLPIALGGEAGKAGWLAVGKPGFTGSGREQGSVALYERGENGWKPQAELMLGPAQAVQGALPFFGPDPGAVFFGAFVEAEGSRLAVIATFANAAYVFERQDSDWTYQFRIIPVDENGGGDDFQRRTVAMSGNSLLMGSPGELGGGEVYLFDLAP